MRFLFCGDIVGKPGRIAVQEHVPFLREHLKLDFVVANAENAAHGFGMTSKICEDLFSSGIDVITGGNHSWDKAEIIPYIQQEERLLRPVNFPDGTPGKGYTMQETASGQRVLVINVMGRLFMEPLGPPADMLDRLLPDGHPVSGDMDAIIIDFHAEATGEKYAFAHLADGRASLVVGTHTHVPTADSWVLPNGTAFQCDAGMCGDYDSVIGMEKNASMERFVGRVPRPRLQPAEGVGTLCGVYVVTDDKTGLAVHVEGIRVGGHLPSNIPDPYDGSVIN